MACVIKSTRGWRNVEECVDRRCLLSERAIICSRARRENGSEKNFNHAADAIFH
jgi:hypothetical protein